MSAADISALISAIAALSVAVGALAVAIGVFYLLTKLGDMIDSMRDDE